MKNNLFLIPAIIFSFQLIAQISPASDTCIPVPWVYAEEQNNGNTVIVTWGIPCDTCEVEKYRLVWIDDFNPCTGETPEDGNWHHRTYSYLNYFSGNIWGDLPSGYYAYGIEAVYDYCKSVRIYSNIIYKDLFNYYPLTVTVTLEDGGNPEGANVFVDGATLCNDSLSYFKQSDNDGNALFEEVMSGEYNLTITKPGYQTAFIANYIHFKDSTTIVELVLGIDPPPAEFTVNAQNGLALWTIPSLKNNQNTLQSFKIRLADSLVATLAPDEYSYQFESLIHGTEYTASISAIYDWGESETASYTFVTDFVGINENIESAKVDIFPNPATNQINIQSEDEILQIEMVNFVGQTVFEVFENKKQITVNTSKLEEGIYIVRVKTAKGMVNKRIVIKN